MYQKKKGKKGDLGRKRATRWFWRGQRGNFPSYSAQRQRSPSPSPTVTPSQLSSNQTNPIQSNPTQFIFLLWLRQSMAMESALIFMGTGGSSSVPYSRCLIRPSDPPCSVCVQSLSLPPHLNPNYRCNTSLLIDYYSQTDCASHKHKYILIDCGKTFREAVLRWFVSHHIPRIDSVSHHSTTLFNLVAELK